MSHNIFCIETFLFHKENYMIGFFDYVKEAGKKVILFSGRVTKREP